MTNREAYVFGWVFGRLNAAAYPQEIGGDLTLAAQRPYTALARVISDAHRLGLLRGISTGRLLRRFADHQH